MSLSVQPSREGAPALCQERDGRTDGYLRTHRRARGRENMGRSRLVSVFHSGCSEAGCPHLPGFISHIADRVSIVRTRADIHGCIGALHFPTTDRICQGERLRTALAAPSSAARLRFAVKPEGGGQGRSRRGRHNGAVCVSSMRAAVSPRYVRKDSPIARGAWNIGLATRQATRTFHSGG